MKGRGGFTLLELLMVVIILAILASVALPQYLRVAERSRTAEALSMLAGIRESELRYRAQDSSQKYTSTIGSLDADFNTSTADWTYTVALGATNLGSAARKAGIVSGAAVLINFDTGNVCASTAAAAGNWGLTFSATC